MHFLIIVPPRLLHDSRRSNTARAIVRRSIYTWVKYWHRVHCEARYIDHSVHGDAFMECLIDGIDTDMATNTRQFQSHLQNKLTAVVRNDWRKHVWFRAALKFKWDFKAQSEESDLNRIQARRCSCKGFHRRFSSSPCDPAQPTRAKLPVTAKAPDPATRPTKETNVPALSEIVKSLDVTINE